MTLYTNIFYGRSPKFATFFLLAGKSYLQKCYSIAKVIKIWLNIWCKRNFIGKRKGDPKKVHTEHWGKLISEKNIIIIILNFNL